MTPEILILDEPTSGCDLELKFLIWDYLIQLNKEGKTIFLTTHYMEEAEKLCKTIGIINNGIHRDAHVVDHVDDVFDLFRIDDFARQMIVHFSVSEVALLLAARDQQFELRLTLVRDLSRGACWRFFDQGGRPVK